MQGCRSTVTIAAASAVVFFFLFLDNTLAQKLPCLTDAECEAAFMTGSKCRSLDEMLFPGVVEDDNTNASPPRRYCQSPFSRGGCLFNLQRSPNHRGSYRVCHSEDSAATRARGDCRDGSSTSSSSSSLLDYAEIRVSSQNWEGAFAEAWMLQILLTEVLGVPVTIETGLLTGDGDEIDYERDASVDFYHPLAALDYGTSNDWSSMHNAHQAGGDCQSVLHRQTQQTNDEDDNGSSRSCAHVVPEVWAMYLNRINELARENIIEGPVGLGVVGQQFWYIPRFTAQRDPTLLTFFGLATTPSSSANGHGDRNSGNEGNNANDLRACPTPQIGRNVFTANHVG